MIVAGSTRMLRPSIVNAWADRVFHVLAHVGSTARLASSVFDPAYVALVERSLGDACGRSLGQDAAMLGRLLPTHDILARAQLLAWLFRSPERAAAARDRDLSDLAPDDVDAPDLLPSLIAVGPPVEVLRCAVELEAEAHARLPVVVVDLDGLAVALAEMIEAAPSLAGHRIGVVRALGTRGRVLGGEIWIGLSSTEHMTWQAAHEATVWEVAEELRSAGEAASYDRVEPEAIERLARRARRVRMEAAHRMWLSGLRLPDAMGR